MSSEVWLRVGKVLVTPQSLFVYSPLFQQYVNLKALEVENGLLVLAFGTLSELGFEVWIQKGCGLDRCFPSVLGSGTKYTYQISMTKIR